MELMTSWKLEGIEIGRVEGRMEGRFEEAQRLALKLLRRRIGNVSEFQETQIRRLNLDMLEDLTDALLDFTLPDDLDAWLKEKTGAEQQENG